MGRRDDRRPRGARRLLWAVPVVALVAAAGVVVAEPDARDQVEGTVRGWVDDLRGVEEPDPGADPAQVPPPDGLVLPDVEPPAAPALALGAREVSPAQVRRTLAGPLGQQVLGGRVAVAVAGLTGPAAYSSGGAATPASTTKLVTAVAALHTLEPGTTFATRVVADGRDVVLVGGGNVGLAVAQALESRAERIRAKVIEKNRKCAERAADILERTIVLNGDGLDAALLKEANIHRADAVLTVTDDDKVNMLAAVRAKAAGCPMAIALINDPTLVPLMGPLGIDAYINPRTTTVSSILRHIRHGRVRGVYSVGDAEAEVIEAEVLSTSPIAGQRIRDIDFPEGVLVGAVLQEGKVMRPTGALRIEEGNVIALFSMTKDVPEVERLLQVSIDFF